jgi:trk system potassium uptake protein
MNIRLVCKFLGAIAYLLGGCMTLSLPWALPIFGGDWLYEQSGFFGIVGSMLVCFVVGAVLRHYGRDAHAHQLFRREAMAVVGLSWVLATILGALPYVFSGTERAPDVKMHYVDAMFEAQSGFSTTGSTVLAEMEDAEMVPRCIMFWRSSTHFLGGLGIIVLFVVILGQGSAGKAMMQAEMPGPSATNVQSRMQHTAWILFYIYVGLNLLLTLLLCLQGVPLFDSLCHAFGTMATGGFSTYNASVGHFTTDKNLNGGMIEMTITVFMILAGTNFMLMYLTALRGVKTLWHDEEWKVYVSIILVATLCVWFAGLANGDFDHYGTSDLTIEGETTAPEGDPSMGQSFRYSIFQVVSIMTTTGFCTDEFENWNAFAAGILIILMFVGASAGSTGGGIKVVRYILGFKILRLELERGFRPSVVRPLRLNGDTVEDPDLKTRILVYFTLMAFIFCASWLFVLAVEPTSTWTAFDQEGKDEHKLIDSASAVAATLNNIGPGLGLIGARQNYGEFSILSKIAFIWLMMLGRLELFVILVLFLPRFWRKY